MVRSGNRRSSLALGQWVPAGVVRPRCGGGCAVSRERAGSMLVTQGGDTGEG